MKGDYFCFLDADDRLPENSLEVRADYLDAHPEIDMLDGWVMVMDAKMQEVHRLYGPHYYGKVARFFIRISEEHFFGLIMMIRNRGQAYRFKEGMSHVEDLWFYTKLAWLENLNYGTVDDVIYHCRKSPGTASTNLDGLERGYWEFYRNVKALPGVSRQELRYLKRRIARIMTLSFLRAGRFYRAFRASLNYFFPKR